MACRLCGAPVAREVLAQERMLGLGGSFRYQECSSCGTVQIAEPPPDQARYYGGGYYTGRSGPDAAYRPAWKGAIRQLLERLLLSPLHAPADVLVGTLLQQPELVRRFAAWRRLSLRRHDRILDLGCGSGTMSYALWQAGYHGVLGVDPHLPHDITFPMGLQLLARRVEEVEGPFDAIVLDHVLEHLEDPLATLREVRRRLAPGGRCLVRIPTASSEAWARYGLDWVQLDAPRHLHLPGRRAVAVLAERAGLRLLRVVDDSSAFQFWGSEQYRRGIALLAPDSYAVDRTASPWTRSEIRRFERQAVRLNRSGRGDQISIYLSC